MLDQRRSSLSLEPTHAQVAWISARDHIGATIDDYLRTEPAKEMRRVLVELEASLRAGDRAIGLL